MMKKERFFRKAYILPLAACMMLIAAPAGADQSGALKALLVDVSGWSAQKAEGMDMNMGGIKMINAIRNYSSPAGKITVTVIAGNNAMLQGQTQPAQVETADAKMNFEKIQGFDVIKSFDKRGKTGSIIVTLAKKQTEGSMMVVSYEGVSSEKALEFSKKFDWNKLKSVSGKLLK